MRALGIARIRLYMPWAAIAPAPSARTAPGGFDPADPASYPAANWSFFDRVMRLAGARGIGIDLTIGSPPPLWAAGPGAPPGGPFPQWKPSAAAFGQFVRAVGRRYSGTFVPASSSAPLPRVDFWSVWNEPNYGPDLAPQAIDDSTIETSPALYRHLVDAAWSALDSSGHGRDTILIGEMAPRGLTLGDNPGNFSGMVPLRFIRALYCVDSSGHPLRGSAATARSCPATAGGSARFRSQNPGLFEASGFAIHPYPQGLPPSVPTPDEPDYADLPKLPQLEALLDSVQARYGSATRFPIYITEYGYKTDPPDTRGGAVSPAVAAAYLNWAEYIAWRDPRVRSWDQYQLADPPRSSGSDFDTGLQFSGGRPKPSFFAFRMPIFLPVTRARRGASLEVWGCVRPFRYSTRAGAADVVRVQFRGLNEPDFRALETVTVPDRDGYIDTRVRFPSSGLVRLAWSSPGTGELFSRVVPVSLQ